MAVYKVLYVYILQCSDGTYYVGVTNDADRRLQEHNTGINKEAYTYKRRPCKILFSELFTDFQLALEWETRIKKWSRAKKGSFDQWEVRITVRSFKEKIEKII